MLLAVLLFIVASVPADSQCPDRQSIYPCSCLSIPQGKKVFFTSVTCHRLHSTDSLMAIFPALRAMTIDHFYLYDSFWDANKLETSEDKQVLPTDWMTHLRVKEIEIVDTTLSNSFACHSKVAVCRNSITTRFTAVNSSSHDRLSTVCGNDTSNSPFTWTECLSKLRQFHFQSAKLTIVDSNLFPKPMRELTEVDLSYNQISKIEAGAFRNTPRLKVLNLSHNALQNLSAMFSGRKLEALEQLDVSWNLIKSLGPSFFVNIPSLKSLKAGNNQMEELKEKEWEGIGKDLKVIDLIDNPLHCDCNIRWVNTTLHINAVIHGVCVSPEDYVNSQIRRASRLLNERCDKDGNIGTRPNTKKAPATTPSSS